MDIDLSTIGKRIGHYRRLNGMSAEELAGRMSDGLTRAVITNLENGRKDDVTVTQLIALSAALGVPPVALAVDLSKPWQFHDLLKTEDGRRQVMSAWDMIDWFSGGGEMENRFELLRPAGREAFGLISRLRTYKRRQWQRVQLEDEIATLGTTGDPEQVADLERELSDVRRSLHAAASTLRRAYDIDVAERDTTSRPEMLWERR
jgi:transcriptional regulator with XRE-family HTH domain